MLFLIVLIKQRSAARDLPRAAKISKKISRCSYRVYQCGFLPQIVSCRDPRRIDVCIGTAAPELIIGIALEKQIKL